jgi:DnaJ-class molecular chaperone
VTDATEGRFSTGVTWRLCPTCHGDGTTEPDLGTQTRPWCRTCLGTGVMS